MRQKVDTDLTPGMRVRWTYEHHTNGCTSFHRHKLGVYHGYIRHTVKHWRKWGAKQMAAVTFEGNKCMSFVPLDDLVRWDV